MTSTSGWVVPYGTVEDTTTGQGWREMTITAYLAEPIIGLDTNPMCFDGPLSWCAYQAATELGVAIPPIRREWCVDFVLPLATWTASPSRPGVDPRLLAGDGTHVWGWACSQAQYAATAHTSAQVRRRPPTVEMSRYTRDAKHHAGLGPLKARDAIMPATIVDTIRWHALGDPDGVSALLTHLTHIGRVTGHGNGRVRRITVEPGRGDWRHRPWPDPLGTPAAIRAPYHHHSRRMPCL